MLALTRRVVEGVGCSRRREEWQWAPTFMLGRGLYAGLMLGIVGFGRIGQAVGQQVGPMECTWCTRGGIPAGRPRRLASLRARTKARRLERGMALCSHMPREHEPDKSLTRGALADALAEGRPGRCARRFRARAGRQQAARPRQRRCSAHIASATHEAREAMCMLCVALRDVLLP